MTRALSLVAGALIGTAAGGAAALAQPPAGGVADVVVTGKKPREQVQLDRRVYNVDQDIQSSTGTAVDVLNQIPSVEVDADGAVSLRGDSHVVVLVDGKPSARLTGTGAGLGLSTLAGAEIARIEVMTNPPAQYKAEGAAGVINIVTKRSRKSGLTGAAQLNVGNDRRYNGDFSAHYSRGPLHLSGDFNIRRDYRLRNIRDTRTAVDPATQQPNYGHETLRESVLRLIPEAKFSIDYDLGPSTTFGASTNHHELTGKRGFDQFDQSGPSAADLISLSKRHSDGREWNQALDEEAHLDHKLGPDGEALSASYHHSVEREREVYTNTTQDLVALSPLTTDHLHLNQDLAIDEASADYTRPLGPDQDLKLGYDLEVDHNRFDQAGDNVDPLSGALLNNAAITNHFRYLQTINSLYANADLKPGRWQAQLGLRAEQTDISARQLLGGAGQNRQGYLRLYPSVHLSRSLTPDLSLTLAASRRVTRPDPEALNPLVDYQDVHNLRAGNANLKPQDTQSFEAGLQYTNARLNYGLTGYYRFNRNAVTDVVQVVGPNLLLSTKANLPKSKSAGVEFSVDGPLTRQITVGASGNLFYLQIDASGLGVAAPASTALQSTLGLNLKAHLDYHPTRQDTAQIFFTRSDKRLTPQGSIDAINLVNLGYRRQLRPDLALVFTASDVLDGQRYRRFTSGPGLQDRYQRTQYGRLVFFGLQYVFGGGKPKASGFDYDKS